MDKYLQTAYSEEIRNLKHKVESNLPEIARIIADIFKPYSETIKKWELSIEQYRPVFAKIAQTTSIFSAIDKLGDNQYVLWKRMPPRFLEVIKDVSSPNEIDALIEQYIEVDNVGTSDHCKQYLGENVLFCESVIAFQEGLYNLSIVGLVSVLDRVMSECSGMIGSMNFDKRAAELEKKIEDKGEMFLEEIEAQDYLIYLTYFKAIDGVGEGSRFDGTEPEKLSRPWLSHGRSNRKYTRIECIKVMNMIYGTFRMSEIGKE